MLNGGGGVYRGELLHSYMVNIINHYDRIPIKQPGFNRKVSEGPFFSWLTCESRGVNNIVRQCLFGEPNNFTTKWNDCLEFQKETGLGGGFKYVLFSSLLGEDSHFD